MVISPVIFLTVVGGIAGMRELGAVGRVAAKALGYFIVVSTIALFVGLAVANVVQPGAGMGIDPATLNAGAVADYAHQAHETTLVGFLMAIIPTTMVSALTDGSILQTLFVAILFGVALSLVGEPARPVFDLVERLTLIVFHIVGILMRLAPIGAFGAIAFTVGQYGAGSLVKLGGLVATFYATSILFVVVVLGAIAQAARLLDPEAAGVSEGRTAAGAGHLVVRSRFAQPHDQAGGGRVRPRGRRAGRADGLFVQPGRHQHLHDAGGACSSRRRAGVHLSFGDQLALMAVAMLSSKGAAGSHGRGVHHAGRHACRSCRRYRSRGWR